MKQLNDHCYFHYCCCDNCLLHGEMPDVLGHMNLAEAKYLEGTSVKAHVKVDFQ